MIARSLAVVLALALLFTWSGRASAEEPSTLDEIAKDLICQCGCGLTVDACGGAMECGVADQMRQVIAARLSQGETKPQILNFFVGQYGEKVQAAPKKEGFNLTAWVLPFVAIAAGGGLIYIVLMRWVHWRAAPPAQPAAQPAANLGEYQERLRRELEQFE